MLADAVLVWSIIGVGVAVVVAGLTGWLVAQGIAARKARAHEAEIALAGVPWHFKFEIRAKAGPGEPARPPLEIHVVGANVWVHNVRLSWRPSRDKDWTTDDAICPPWRPEDTLPMQLFTTSRAMELGWPGPNPAQQEQIHQRIRLEWSATEDGPKHWRDADGGTTGWQ